VLEYWSTGVLEYWSTAPSPNCNRVAGRDAGKAVSVSFVTSHLSRFTGQSGAELHSRWRGEIGSATAGHGCGHHSRYQSVALRSLKRHVLCSRKWSSTVRRRHLRTRGNFSKGSEFPVCRLRAERTKPRPNNRKHRRRMSYDRLHIGTVFRLAHFLRRWLGVQLQARMAEDWPSILPRKQTAQDCSDTRMAELFHIRPERVSGRGQQTKTSWATRLGFCHK
jgi:hypothetical protein